MEGIEDGHVVDRDDAIGTARTALLKEPGHQFTDRYLLLVLFVHDQGLRNH